MSRSNLKTSTKSRTDWEAVRKTPENARIPYSSEDGPYDPNDKDAVKAYWESATVKHKGKVVRSGRGPQKAPIKERITIRLSHEVVEHFRATGEGWQTRMDEALKRVVFKAKRTA